MAKILGAGLSTLAPVALLFVALATPVAVGDGGHRPKAHQAVIGGAPAQDGTFLSLAYILYFHGKVGEACTGTVVAPSLVLTAGHCAVEMNTGVVNRPEGFRVVTGSVDWATGERQISQVLGVIPFPGLVRHLDVGDAALLVLSQPVSAPPVTLAPPSQTGLAEAGTTATVAGWGRTSFEQATLTEQLNTATTVVQGARWCARNAPPFFAKGELCTITPPKYLTGACNGDSGGPLLVPGPVEGETVEVGVSVHVYGKCSTHRPTVYTRVDFISAWVRGWVDAYNQPTGPRPH
ncbi:MAG TPA: trypsin-like serine protease [Solirubrobacteraceae bacterium]